MLATHLRKILAAKTLATPKTEKKVILSEESVMKVEVAEVPSHLTAVDMRKIGCLSGLRGLVEWKLEENLRLFTGFQSKGQGLCNIR